jgi:galactose mutarotase-like enzyme
LDKNIIKIPGKKEMILEQVGLDFAVVWVFQNPDTKEFDKNYVCIEPLQRPVDSFGKPESMIKNGEKVITKLILR